jgi:hypothetical protein
MEKKVCIKCKEEKELTEFHIGRYECKLCRKKYYENNKDKVKEYKEKNKDKIKEYRKKYNENNIDKIKEYNQEYSQSNKDKIKEISKKYYGKNKDKIKEINKKYYGKNKDRINKNCKEYRVNNKDKRKEISKKYYGKNIDKIKEYNKKYNENNIDKIKEYYENNKDRIRNRNKQYVRLRIQSDPIYRLTRNIRTLIGKSIKNKGYDKKSKTYEILGITFEEFKLHIESQWEEWMNWNNYGLYNREEKYGWDFDHIIPLSSVNIEEDIIRLNHYTNFQPLCSYVNRYVKKDKINYKVTPNNEFKTV